MINNILERDGKMAKIGAESLINARSPNRPERKTSCENLWQTRKNAIITPYHDQPCHDLTACGARCIRILELLLDFELRRTVEEPKNKKTSFPGFWFPGPGNRCRDVFGDSKSTREPVLKALSEC